MGIMNQEVMELKEVARMLKVSERTLIRLVERGELLGFKVGDRWRFYRSDIEKYIDDQRKPHKSGE